MKKTPGPDHDDNDTDELMMMISVMTIFMISLMMMKKTSGPDLHYKYDDDVFDGEDARTSCTTLEESSKPEDDCSLIFLKMKV